MKRAWVSCAALALLGAAACSSSNPTLPSGLIPDDGGPSERGATLPPDTRPLPMEVGEEDLRKGGPDAPLIGDATAAGTDTAPPSIVLVSISSPATATGGDGGVLPTVVGASARLAPSVRIEVQSRGGDPTADVMALVSATLIPENSTTTAASAALNQTSYQVVPETGSKIFFYGDTPLDLSKVKGGYYTLQVTATTAGGVTGTDALQIYLDAGPLISISQPADGVFVKGSLVLNAVVSDTAGVASVVFSVGQTTLDSKYVSANAPQYTVNLDFGSFNPPLQGQQVITITATNANGIASIATRKFTVDNDGPTITGTKPAAGALIGRLITIEAQVSDPAGVMDSSVIAVVANGGVNFEVKLAKGSDGAYRNLFDTTKLPVYTIFPSISFRAQDVLGNQSSVGYLLSLDNTPPIMDLDPPAHVQLIMKDGTCSWPFDPVGPDAIDDGSVVNQLFDIRARVEDQGNTPQSGTADFVIIAYVDPTSVKVLILDDTSLPLVVDTSDPPDGICDDINPDLIPSVAPQSSKEAQVINLVTLSPGGAGDFSHIPGVACSGTGEPPAALCETTYNPQKNRAMTYSMGYSAAGQSSIWTIPPIVGDGLQCAGRQFDASNGLSDGWACAAVQASDMVGNKQVSRPIRICVAAQPGSTACTAASSGGADLASVSLPSTINGKVVVTTTAAVTGPGNSPVVLGDTLVFTNVSPSTIGSVNGDHQVQPVGATGTQFVLTDLSLVPADLWVDLQDGTTPTLKGSVGVVIQDGVDVQVVTDLPGTPLDPNFAGAVILLAKGASTVGLGAQRWLPGNILPTGFSLRNSAMTLSGFATSANKLPNCTGTLIKGVAGAQPKVDATMPCKPWMSFPDREYIEAN